MNDILLSSLINLFAICCKKGEVDIAASRVVLDSYLHRHFGIRDTEMWLDMYDSLTGLYAMSTDLDTNAIIDNICQGLHGKISTTEKIHMVLRLIEFCGVDSLNQTECDMLWGIAQKFDTDQQQFDDFINFVTGHESHNVRIHTIGDGRLKTMFIRQTGTLVFTFTGHDLLLLNDVPTLRGTFQIMQKSSVLKTRSMQPLYYSTLYKGLSPSEDNQQSEAITFAAHDLDFRFPNSDNGIHHFSFTLESGTLLAIMGGSGAGKTTLMSLLCGTLRPTGTHTQPVTINGHSIYEKEVQKLIGYVPQDDLLIEELTVRENLWYTARLCFAGMSPQQLSERVDQTLRDLGLEKTANLKVGSPLNKTISGGQRKRLNIALELIRQPSVLFLDEPTSGLSSADTEMVINLLKEQTVQGKLIIVNIHQPSSDVYKLFDRLWILDSGGYPVYDGNPIDAITYFKHEAMWADPDTSMCPLCGNLNPEVILSIIDEKSLDSTGTPTTQRKTTPQQWNQAYIKAKRDTHHTKSLPEDKSQERDTKTPLPHTPQRTPNALWQTLIYLQRNIRTKLTNKQYLLVTTLVTPILTIICALLTRFQTEEGYTLMDNKNFPTYMFMAVIVATFTGMTTTAEEIIHERTLLRREKFLHLNYQSYILSKIIYAAIISLAQTLIFTLIGNTIIGLHSMTTAWWSILFATSLLSNLTGLLLSQCLSSIVAIYITIPILLIPQILLCGVVVDFKDLTPHSTTGNVPLIGNLIPSRWAYEALAVETYTHNPYEKSIFQYERRKYQAMYYKDAFLYELQSQATTMHHELTTTGTAQGEHLAIIRTNLPILTRQTGQKPFTGPYSHAHIKAYLNQAQDILSKQGNQATLQADRLIATHIKQTSHQEQAQLKRNNTNNQLRDMVMNATATQAQRITHQHIVPTTLSIYLSPQSPYGGAPFYSSTKRIGQHEISTPPFNLAVLYLMSLILSLLLLTDTPGRQFRKE